ncbi:MAG: HAD family hydrolase, partial [Burkholderiales bacterium]
MPRHLVWVFDLDNTLHNANPHIFPHLNRAMTAYLQTHLGLNETAADALRQHYWRKYGATIQGLLRHHATDPRHFLQHTHQFPKLERMLLVQPGLRKMLKTLPGKKVVFSNSPAHYAAAVLKAMKIGHLFHNVFSIEKARYQPKPRPYAFWRLLEKIRMPPQR